jgi:hypothetical protein
MLVYKVKADVLLDIRDHINALLELGVTPGYCMDIIRGQVSDMHELEIYDTGNYQFQVRIIKRKTIPL